MLLRGCGGGEKMFDKCEIIKSMMRCWQGVAGKVGNNQRQRRR